MNAQLIRTMVNQYSINTTDLLMMIHYNRSHTGCMVLRKLVLAYIGFFLPYPLCECVLVGFGKSNSTMRQ